MLVVKPFKKKYSISDHFGRVINPLTNQEEFNSGINFDMPLGTPLFAVVKGKIKFGCNEEHGNYVQLSFKTENFLKGYFIYSHLSQVMVLNGGKVMPGDLIGFSGNIPKTKKQTLNFQLHLMLYDKKYVPVNVSNYFNFS